MTKTEKDIYLFEEGSLDLKPLLGGKGASLAEMTNLGLPVPPGMTITTKACKKYHSNQEKLPENIIEGINEYLTVIEEKSGKEFGSQKNPLLLSVRSGAASSMPGMMDTILNLGLNDQTVEALAEKTSDERFAYDCYRRFIQMYGEVVLKVPSYKFHQTLDKFKSNLEIEQDLNLTVDNLKELIDKYKKIIAQDTEGSFPQDVNQQLITAVEAVFASWNNERSIIYRKAHDMDHSLGTAVNIQAMVFGNLNNQSATGVLFTRNPSTGAKELYGEYLLNAQGEDIVAGIRTPNEIQSLEDEQPKAFNQLMDIVKTLEDHYQDMQDIEFTIEDGKLYLLQTRTGKRTASAAIKIAVDMAKEGLITKETALLRVNTEQIEKILHSQIDPEATKEVIAKGLPASPGAAYGKIVFSADEAEELAEEGTKVILVSAETSPEDINGVLSAEGVLTTRGGMTSHAAVVARGMGKPCVCGCDAVKIDFTTEEMVINQQSYPKGTKITINGATGEVILGEVDMTDAKLSSEAELLLDWANDTKELKILANADNEIDSKKAVEFGAEGIGLCRTEHMFVAEDRLDLMQELILSQNDTEQEEILTKLEKMQLSDFKELFTVMAGKEVSIRLLDPPLHEFLPDKLELSNQLIKAELNDETEGLAEKKKLFKAVNEMSETNPMLGFRGCRLGIIVPAIYEMQIRAIFNAAIASQEAGEEIKLKIMFPLIADYNEFKVLADKVKQIAKEIETAKDLQLDYQLGTMIELPRACLTADKIAKEADFFSFGTNDLTQTTFGFSRDDAEGKFLNHYLEQNILANNPFISLDPDGVGRLVKMAVDSGKAVNSALRTGICGEHGGEPNSIALCHSYGMEYVSCSPYRIPVARLAAAQAKLNS